MTPFLASLARDDLAPATLRGYRYDLRHFLAWHRTVHDGVFAIEGLAEFELIAYRQHMVAAGRRPATVNRRLDALRRLCRWGCQWRLNFCRKWRSKFDHFVVSSVRSSAARTA
jgi:site-specific recombinase XerD